MLADFHFLRPWWLLALLPCVLLVVWFARARGRSPVWSRLIDPLLLQHLLLPARTHRSLALPVLLLGGWALAVIALAGPAWERLPEPVQRNDDALIIALGLDTGMLATDIAPSRLQRARHKIADILAMRYDGLAALIVYAGDAHVVTPLSDDANTLAAMLPALDPAIMPRPGNDPGAAVELAAQLLRGSGLQRGRILFITDAFPRSTHAAVADAVRRTGLELSLLAVGTAQGSPIPLPEGGFQRDRKGAITLARIDPESMREGAALAGGRFATLGIDDTDIRHLLPPPSTVRTRLVADQQHHFDRWQDRTPWLAVALLPLAALAFRRGWLLGALLVVLLPAPHANALEWNDLWLNKDQQAQRALADGNPDRAAELFSSPAWQGAARFQAGQYDAAAQAWSKLDDATAHYNRGNALALGGDLQGAIAAYDEALQRQPGFEDALANRRLVEELLHRNDGGSRSGEQRNHTEQPATEDGESGTENRSGSARDESATEQATRSPSQGSTAESQHPTERSASGSDTDDDEESSPDRSRAGDADKPVNGPDASDDGEAAGTEGAADGSEPGNDEQSDQSLPGDKAAQGRPHNEEDEAMEHWLRSLPDDPGELLRRKFEYESRLQRDPQEGLTW